MKAEETFDGVDAEPSCLAYIGDESARYVVDIQEHYQALQRSIEQLSGLLLSNHLLKRATLNDQLLIDGAKTCFSSAWHGIQTTRPTGSRAAHHYKHLCLSASAVRILLNDVSSDALALSKTEANLHLLSTAWRQLVFAGRSLPGFQTMDVSQACCASHMRLNMKTQNTGSGR